VARRGEEAGDLEQLLPELEDVGRGAFDPLEDRLFDPFDPLAKAVSTTK
jgi:hypothetical protein